MSLASFLHLHALYVKQFYLCGRKSTKIELKSIRHSTDKHGGATLHLSQVPHTRVDVILLLFTNICTFTHCASGDRLGLATRHLCGLNKKNLIYCTIRLLYCAKMNLATRSCSMHDFQMCDVSANFSMNTYFSGLVPWVLFPITGIQLVAPNVSCKVFANQHASTSHSDIFLFRTLHEIRLPCQTAGLPCPSLNDYVWHHYLNKMPCFESHLSRLVVQWAFILTGHFQCCHELKMRLASQHLVWHHAANCLSHIGCTKFGDCWELSFH